MRCRMTVLVDIEAPDAETVFITRLKLERHLAELSHELSRLKSGGTIYGNFAAKIREVDAEKTKG